MVILSKPWSLTSASVPAYSSESRSALRRVMVPPSETKQYRNQFVSMVPGASRSRTGNPATWFRPRASARGGSCQHLLAGLVPEGLQRLLDRWAWAAAGDRAAQAGGSTARAVPGEQAQLAADPLVEVE